MRLGREVEGDADGLDLGVGTVIRGWLFWLGTRMVMSIL